MSECYVSVTIPVLDPTLFLSFTPVPHTEEELVKWLFLLIAIKSKASSTSSSLLPEPQWCQCGTGWSHTR